MNDTSLKLSHFVLLNFKMDERSSTDLFLNYSGRDLYRSSYSGPWEFLEIRGREASRDQKKVCFYSTKIWMEGGQNLPFCPPCNHNCDGTALQLLSVTATGLAYTTKCFFGFHGNLLHFYWLEAKLA